MAGRGVEESSTCTKKFKHQLFLSFRGADTRNFVGHLFCALKTAGLRVFFDNDGLEHGQNIQSKLLEAIRFSEMSVVMLSSGYADSRWCLDELVKIMELEALRVHSVLPVFYDVESTVVRHQTGVYMDAFKVLEDIFSDEMDKIQKWRSALKRVASLRGLSLNADKNEPLLVENIIQIVRKMVAITPLYVPPNIIGRHSILNNIDLWLQDGSQDVEVGIIYGFGGVGKSTVAKIAYNNNACKFDGCSFLDDFTRKTFQPGGLACLLEQVILDVTGKPGDKIQNVDKGMNDVRAILNCKRVLLVLDDIDELKYLPGAFDDRSFFGEGSKIIITSRNEELRKVSLFKKKFPMTELSFTESKELLKVQALLNEDNISQRKEELIEGFLQHCLGLPLALSVMGPLLRNETEEMWECLLTELKTYPDHKIFDVFRLSFECISDKYTRELFLYIACFFVGIDKGYAVKVLEGCRLRPLSGLQNLINRCLVIVDYQGKLIMHQLIEEMGKEVARQEAVSEPGRRSKLWSTKDSLSVLQNVKGTSTVRGMRVHLPKSDSPYISMCQRYENFSKRIRTNFGYLNPWRFGLSLNLMTLRTSSFTMMTNLELLLLNHVELDGDYAEFPTTLKWLSWRGCPLHCIPSNFNLNLLVAFDLQKSCLIRAWKGGKDMGALRILNLSFSQHLVSTPDLSSAPMLEWLFLENCICLVSIHESIGNLVNLTHLNLKGCTSLLRVNETIGNLKKLIILNLEGCKRLMRFSIPVSVEQLNLSDCSSFFQAPYRMQPLLPQYQGPSPPFCFTLNNFLPALKELSLTKCGISTGDDVLEFLKCVPSLEVLDLSGNPIRVLHVKNTDQWKNLSSRIHRVILNDCYKLHSISQLPWRCQVSVNGCSSLKKVLFLRESNKSYSLHATRCYELVEVDFDCNDRVVIEYTRDLSERKANRMCYPNLHTFVRGTVLKNERNNLGSEGYRGGTYQVLVSGDHLSNWFSTIATARELSYVVDPSNPLRIRALNIGFCLSATHCGTVFYHVQVKNRTSMWEWTLSAPPNGCHILEAFGASVTWLSHWCVMERRDIKPGDLLDIFFLSNTHYLTLKWGIQVIYKENQEDEEPSDLPVNNRSHCQIIDLTDEATTCSIHEDTDTQNEAEVTIKRSIDVWYNNTVRSPPHDLSIFEIKRLEFG